MPFGICPMAACTLPEMRRIPRRLYRETEAGTGQPQAAHRIRDRAAVAPRLTSQIVILG
jgi:hypothetical protein